MKKKFCFLLICLTLLLTGCGSQMKDGFYTAEMAEYEHGWKEYICILVKNDTIVYAEFNAKNPSGYIKAWDNAYMKNMNSIAGTYPNEYTRYYVNQLIDSQNPSEIDALSGATHSYNNFQKLAFAVMEQAKLGNPDTMIVE